MHFGTSMGASPAVRRGIVGFLVFWSVCVLMGSICSDIEYYGALRNAVTGDLPGWYMSARWYCPAGRGVHDVFSNPLSRLSSEAISVLAGLTFFALSLLFWPRKRKAEGRNLD